jgi:glycopeptide antibiotics resistance protein
MKQLISGIFTAPGIKKYTPGIAWFFLTIIAISIPGKELPKFGAWFEQISFDKLIHTFLFGMVAFLWMLPVGLSTQSKKSKYYWCIKVSIASAIWGLTAELIQKYFIPGRSYDLIDLLANTLGVIVAYIYMIWRIKKQGNGEG